MNRWSWVTPAVVAMAAMGVASCADDGPAQVAAPSPSPSPRAAATLANGQSVRVQSLDNTFRPDALEISVGTEVVFTNDGRNDHDVIASDAADWGVAAEMFAPGDVYRNVFTMPGEYPYFCSIHGTAEFGMIGTIVVTG